ncbi:cell wall hydrolase [Lachnoclostridium sp. Marseille-P6806]|uniref:cell wall hydrolase n=1 Tax=Lachnoclostridium sp. Marseille-P6806 TaxID=2364793 RepID=UPI0013EEEFDF|nr:cell wall hydrolase [Lachnoclostridium sp. Marseille-P6806]
MILLRKWSKKADRANASIFKEDLEHVPEIAQKHGHYKPSLEQQPLPFTHKLVAKSKKTLMVLLFLSGSLLIKPQNVHAAPPGYDKYGELAEEYYCDDLELLACVVQAEAGNQDLKGKELVVNVVLNRMDSDQFPNTIKEIIFQPGQFSTATDGALDRAYYTVTEDDYLSIQRTLTNRIDRDILFFTAGEYNPYGTPAYKYGDHYFSK